MALSDESQLLAQTVILDDIFCMNVSFPPAPQTSRKVSRRPLIVTITAPTRPLGYTPKADTPPSSSKGWFESFKIPSVRLVVFLV